MTKFWSCYLQYKRTKGKLKNRKDMKGVYYSIKMIDIYIYIYHQHTVYFLNKAHAPLKLFV